MFNRLIAWDKIAMGKMFIIMYITNIHIIHINKENIMTELIFNAKHNELKVRLSNLLEIIEDETTSLRTIDDLQGVYYRVIYDFFAWLNSELGTVYFGSEDFHEEIEGYEFITYNDLKGK